MMRYIKFFEEFKGKRVTVKSEDKKKLREITRVIIKYCKEGKLTKNINDKYTIDFDLSELKNLLKSGNYLYVNPNPNRLEIDNKKHKDNDYKLVDDYANKLSKLRGVDIIFDRKNGCFTTASGKAMTTVNVVSEYPKESNMSDNTAGFQNGSNQRVFINYKTGDVVSKFQKSSDYMVVWDFTGDNIYMSINRNIRRARKTDDGKTLLEDIFSTLYHEFIHSNDPLCWANDYLDNKEIYGEERGGVYASHDKEVQTFSNQFLELIEYYFEKTLRGDTDGNGVNYDLPKEHINNVFIPVIMEIVKFINAESDKLSDFVISELSGTNKDSNSTRSVSQHLVNMRNEDAEDGKVIRQWLRDDFNRFVDYYNLKAIEINKKKEKGQELPLLHKGFPFELTPVKPTPENVDEVTDEIEDTKPGIKPVKPTGKKPDNSKLKFVSNPPKLPSWVKNPVVWASDQMEEILNKNLSVLATAYSKCFSNANPNVIVDVKKRLETLLKDLKTNNPIRIKDSVRVFYSNISPKLSDTNVSSWLKSPEGIKWGETIVKYENLVSHILK